MKKFIFLLAGIMVLAAACTNSGSQSNNTPTPTPTPNNKAVYRYTPYNFEFSYSNDWTFTQPAYANLDEKIVQIELAQSTYPNTNFVDAAFSVSVGTATTLNQCLALNAANTAGFKTTQNINGVTYSKAETSEPAAGNLYESRIYRTLRSNLCFELQETIHTGNIANYEPGAVTEVNKNLAWDRLDEVLNTFSFNQ